MLLTAVRLAISRALGARAMEASRRKSPLISRSLPRLGRCTSWSAAASTPAPSCNPWFLHSLPLPIQQAARKALCARLSVGGLHQNSRTCVYILI